jgi:Fic family protein
MTVAKRGRYIGRTWPGNPTGQTRSERVPARYKAYIPEPLADYSPGVPAGFSALLSEADAAVIGLNRLGPTQAAQIEALARQLLRQESLASSRIEGLALSHKRLGEAAYAGEQSSDRDAKAVLANIEAMHQAIAVGADAKRITKRTIEDLHRTLMETTAPEIAGRVRTKQNWVGGRWHTPVGAEFVPPPPEQAKPLLTDLAKFMNRTDLPTTLQAALTHAQFETIHPFADGNGRIGRCLIHVVYKRRGAAEHQVPPVSLLMATDVDKYVEALNGYRLEGELDWVHYFSRTVIDAANAGAEFGARLSDLQEQWRAQARVRGGSTADKLIDLLPAQPVIDVQAAAELTGASAEAARLALNALDERGVVVRANQRDWGRVWEASGLWNLLDRFEQSLATPDGRRRAGRAAPRTR